MAERGACDKEIPESPKKKTQSFPFDSQLAIGKE